MFFNSQIGLLDTDSIQAATDNPLEIGHDVWIGQNVVITPSCRRIGDSAIVAAGAVVACDVPEFAIVAGVPARLLRFRLAEEQRNLIALSKWWLRPVQELFPVVDFFTRPMSDKDWKQFSDAFESISR